MQTATIVKQTKDYLLIKVPLPRGADLESRPAKTTPAEQRLWNTIQEGEKEYREGKTIRAKSIDEALEIYERRKKHKKY